MRGCMKRLSESQARGVISRNAIDFRFGSLRIYDLLFNDLFLLTKELQLA
jgi:hypothetical protein